MPHVDPDCTMIPPCNDIICDRCGSREDWDKSRELVWFWRAEIFRKRPKDHDVVEGTFCLACVKFMTPYVYQLRDVDELSMYVNKLKRAIDERRNQNNRATADDACKRSEGRA